MIHSPAVAHFDIPLDLPHAGRMADRILSFIERYLNEHETDAPEVLDVAERLSSMLFRYSAQDDNPAPGEAMQVREEAAAAGRELVDALVAAGIRNDRLGQFIRNLFECLQLGKEGAEISLRAGENPDSLQRPV